MSPPPSDAIAARRTADLVEVRFEPSGRRARVHAGTTLLEAARGAGLPVASACGAEGVCARCGMRILETATPLPAESDRERDIKRRNRVPEELRLACRVEVRAALAATAPYW